ncbi:DsbA family oxidoreductase [Paenibacillus sp. CMAA1364]
MTMKVEFWSDIVCPYCYIGKKRFEKALAQFEYKDEVEVIWRSFELDPSSPRHTGEFMASLSKKMGRPMNEVQQMIAQMTSMGAQEGLDYRFDIMKAGNTFDAHRLLHFSAHKGLVEEVSEQLYHAYFSEGLPVGDQNALIELAVKAGLDGAEVRTVLEGDSYTDEVRADENQARALQISGVPFVLVSSKYAVSGAQSVDVFLNALRTAWNEAQPIQMVGDAGNSCDDGNCII